MSTGVEFEGDKYTANRPGFQQNFSVGQEKGGSKFEQFLIRKGFAKTTKGAQNILLGIIAFDIVAVFIIIKYFL